MMVTPATIPSAREQADEGVVRRERIPRWVGVVLPVAILGGVGLVALYAVNRSWLPFVLFLAGSAALGLLTGFAARRSLPHRSNMLRWAVAMGALTVGLLAAGIVSGGEVGLGPLLPLVPRVRWGEMVQLASAGLAAWLAVRAFARPEMSSPHAPATEPGQANWGFIYHPTIHDTQPIRARRGARPSAALRASPSAQSIAPRPRADRPSAELTPPRRTQPGPPYPPPRRVLGGDGDVPDAAPLRGKTSYPHRSRSMSDNASYPGGDNASYPGGDNASHPGGDLTVTIVLTSGGARTAEVPDDVAVRDLLSELTSLLKLPT